MTHKIFTLVLGVASALVSFAQQSSVSVVKQNLVQRGFTSTDVDEVVITSQYTTKHNGVTHIYFRQKFKGIEVFNAVGSLHIKQDRVLAVHENFVNNIAAKVTLFEPSVSVNAAISTTAGHLMLQAPSALTKTDVTLSGNKAEIVDANVSPEPLKVQLYYYVVNNEIKLVYNTSWLDPETNNWWNVRVDATNALVIDKNNWSISCTNHHHRNSFDMAEETRLVAAGAVSASSKPVLNKRASTSARYNAFPLGVESPLHGERQMLVNPDDSLASPYGWHDLDGFDGHENTITDGNNVLASEDRSDNDAGGYSPDGGDSLVFNFPYDTIASPDSNLNAAITNLFVWNNFVHDVMYHYGFDEESGNFQANNYGRGGLENDRVFADAQDGSGTNNANFATPEDGENPRMQMYLWTKGSAASSFLVYTNDTIKDSTEFKVSAFGLRLFDRFSAQMVIAKDIAGVSTLACGNIEDVTGKVVVIDRGSCNFTTKVREAQLAGAIAAVVVNNNNQPITSMTGSNAGDIIIPSFMISKTAGDKLKQLIISGGPVTGTFSASKVLEAYDSDLDNGVITHEYGHGISNRLTGGPANSNCLNNIEQAGEGWSDFFCLVLTHRSTDMPEVGRGIGTWLDGTASTAVGIRTFRYSRNMTVNPLTYDDIKTLAAPHGIGSVWCTMLYDLYWNMIDKYGYDNDLYNGNGGNNRTLRLVMDGLKLQPCSPGFVDARNAILLADQMNNGGADSALIWSTFARRGLGFSASQGLSSSRSDGKEAFDMPVAPSVGLNEMNKESGMSFWPNPNNGNFEVMLPEYAREARIQIYDLTGKCIYNELLSGNGKVTIQSAGIEKGIYILRAESNGKVYSNKMVIAD